MNAGKTRGLIPVLCLALFVLGGCERTEETAWLGYVEGEDALIAPPMPGWLTSIEVARGGTVAEGDMLFTLDATREIAARDNALAAISRAEALAAQADAQGAQATALRAEAEAGLESTSKEFERQQELVQIGASPQRELERAEAAYDSARAGLSQAEAQGAQARALRQQAEAQTAEAKAALATAEFNLGERSVRARVAGTVQDVYFRQGEYANAGVPVLSILPPENVFVRFFVPETELSSLALGDQVRIACDGCPPDLTAPISFIAPEAEFTPPVIYSLANRQKLVFKAEARTPGGLALRPGLPVDVTPLP